MLSRGRRVGQFGMGMKERGDVIVEPEFPGQNRDELSGFETSSHALLDVGGCLAKAMLEERSRKYSESLASVRESDNGRMLIAAILFINVWYIAYMLYKLPKLTSLGYTGTSPFTNNNTYI